MYSTHIDEKYKQLQTVDNIVNDLQTVDLMCRTSLDLRKVFHIDFDEALFRVHTKNNNKYLYLS